MLNHKDTTSQMHSILKEVLFIVASGRIRSQNKNKQQLKDFLTESVDMLNLFDDFYLLCFTVGTLLWKEISSVKQSKLHNFSFNKHRRILFSWKIFHQMDILFEIETNRKLAKDEYEEFIKNINEEIIERR